LTRSFAALLVLLPVACPRAASAAAIAETDRNGRIQSLGMGGDAVAIRTNVRIPLKGCALRHGTAWSRSSWRGSRCSP